MQQEKRSHIRSGISLPVRCVCYYREDESLSFTADATVLNVSDTGLCFYCREDLSECQKIKVFGGMWDKPVIAKIIWNQKLEDTGIYVVGASFQHEDLEYADKIEGWKVLK